jgi:hypothetical protein
MRVLSTFVVVMFMVACQSADASFVVEREDAEVM